MCGQFQGNRTRGRDKMFIPLPLSRDAKSPFAPNFLTEQPTKASSVVLGNPQVQEKPE